MRDRVSEGGETETERWDVVFCINPSSQARELGLLTIHESQVITEPQLLLLMPLPALAMYLRYPDGRSSQFAGICDDGYLQLVQTSLPLTPVFKSTHAAAQCQTVPH